MNPRALESLADPLDALIEWGEVESATADAACPECDGFDPKLDAFRRMMIDTARVYWSGTGRLPRFDASDLPQTVEVSVPEGYAFYALYPRTYGEAAVAFWREARPRSVVVIGVRSIGTSLSAVVCAALEERGCAVRSFTVRPRGHPFDRQLVVSREMAQAWRSAAEARFLVVDEGPGLSGSSFTSVARALREAGVEDERVVFLPGWDADGCGFVSAGAREEWGRHRRYPAVEGPAPEGEDLSAGRWRGLFYRNGDAPASHPQHERRKYLREGRLWKFAGLGRYGRAKWERACVLADAGFVPRPVWLEDGYLVSEFMTGEPCSAAQAGRPALLGRMREYLQFVRDQFPTGERVRVGEIEEMVRINAGDRAACRLLECAPAVEDEGVCAIDGRMLPHEWVETSAGYFKTDALDHHADHFFPGCQSIQWDAAAATIEFDLDQEAAEYLLPHSYESALFHQIAYLSYRIGYCSMAADSAGGAHNQNRFGVLASTYRRRLREVIENG